MGVMEWFARVLRAVGDVWAFRPPADLALGVDSSWEIAVGVALLAGLSTMIGHAVVFAINHVGGVRMVVGMALGAVYMTLLRVGTAAAIALIAWAATAGRVDGETVAITYLFAVAPHVLGFLVFLPHFGLAIGRLLEGWTALSLVVLLSPALGLGWWQALAIGGGTWLGGHLLARLLARPLAAVTSRVWTLATGQETFLTAHDVLSGAPFVPLQRRARRA